MDIEAECIVIGGGVAGLSAALVLGRARRRVVVIDEGRQSNLAADGVGGLLGADRRPPAELYERGRRELGAYPTVELRGERVESTIATATGYEARLAGGTSIGSRVLLLATGMDYRHPDVAGIAERWGHTAFHCPFCHGWEVAGRPLGVLDGSAAAVERSLMLRAWSDDITLFTGGEAGLDGEARGRLEAAGIGLEQRPITELRGPGRELESVGLAGGGERPLGGLLVATKLHQRNGLALSLGAEAAEPNPVVVDAVRVDEIARTSVPGLFAAGDAATRMPSIQNAILSGSMAAASIVRHLMSD